MAASGQTRDARLSIDAKLDQQMPTEQ